MSLGKSSGTQVTTQELRPEQIETINLQNKLLRETVAPLSQSIIGGSTGMYNALAPAVSSAAENLSRTAGQAQSLFGGTGQQALQTGIGGLSSLFTSQYEQQQMEAALLPAQAQYLQNIANQGIQFGGAGQMGSARQALAGQQAASMNMLNQGQLAADVANKVALQRMAAGQALIGAGQTGLTSAQQAAQNMISAAMAPQALYNQYASVLFGSPQSVYNPNFAGTQGSTSTTSGSKFGIDLIGR